MSDDVTIRGQATLEWGDQFRFVTRKLTSVLWKYVIAMIVMFGMIWALTLPDEQWLALRAHPLASLGDFVADAWPFFAGTLSALIAIRSCAGPPTNGRTHRPGRMRQSLMPCPRGLCRSRPASCYSRSEAEGAG